MPRYPEVAASGSSDVQFSGMLLDPSGADCGDGLAMVDGSLSRIGQIR
jgi:hypothetical protein